MTSPVIFNFHSLLYSLHFAVMTKFRDVQQQHRLVRILMRKYGADASITIRDETNRSLKTPKQLTQDHEVSIILKLEF